MRLRPVGTFLAGCVVLGLGAPALAQSNNAEWIVQKRQCGLPAALAYNDWVKQGAPCPARDAAKSGAGSSGTPAAPAAPAAPGHEFDSTINQAISAGMQGKISGADAVGFVGVGLLGNALFAPKTMDPKVQRVMEEERQRKLAAQQLNNSGVFLLKKGNYSGAIHEFEQALARTPGDAVIQRNLAYARQLLKDGATARANSGTLGQVLGDVPMATGGAGTALNLVNVNTDSSVVDLSGATRTSPKLLKEELDGVLGGKVSVPERSLVVKPELKDMELLFAPPGPVVKPEMKDMELSGQLPEPVVKPEAKDMELLGQPTGPVVKPEMKDIELLFDLPKPTAPVVKPNTQPHN